MQGDKDVARMYTKERIEPEDAGADEEWKTPQLSYLITTQSTQKQRILA